MHVDVTPDMLIFPNAQVVVPKRQLVYSQPLPQVHTEKYRIERQPCFDFIS